MSIDHPVRGILFEDVHVTYKGGGTAADALLNPDHDPNDGGPRHMGVRPAYGLWLRHASDVQFTRVTLGFEAHSDDQRPAVILQHAAGGRIAPREDAVSEALVRG